MQAPVKPLRVFYDIDEFVRRHKAGTEAEFEASQRLVDSVNKEENRLKAWVLFKTRETSKRLEYLIVVQPGPDGDKKIPQQGEPAKLRVVFGDDSVTRFWDARRVETPLHLLSTTTRYSEKLAVFEVTVHIADAHTGIRPLFDTSTAPTASNENENSFNYTALNGRFEDSTMGTSSDGSDSGIGGCDTEATITEPTNGTGEITFTDSDAVRVNFLLFASEATKNAELGALDLLCGRYVNASERQIKAFEYFVLLRDPEFIVDLHEQIPHLKTLMEEPSWPNSPLAKKFAQLNPQQKAAYLHGFRKLRCGICILPGGPGAGKTHFNLFTIAMAQSKSLPRPVPVRGRLEKRSPKVLFIVDMNSPVDDVANRMVRLYQELGMSKSVIRMRGWGAEVRTSDRLNAAEDTAAETHIDFTKQFLRTASSIYLGCTSPSRFCQAPSLDEAAWQRYDLAKETKYEDLKRFLEDELWEDSNIVPLRFRRLVYNLYRDTLEATDFIATTPVAASNHFRGMFKPDLVYFDESPHARDLCNLIAIANFDPIAWIFCGDFRQTVPFVGSCDENIYREQMQVSMMERAARANAIQYELLINHRSSGGLHQLASTMWYGGRMVSGNAQSPASLQQVRKYLERFMDGRPCTVPRLLVHIKNCGPEARDGTSAWNPSHTAWVMARVREILHDAEFAARTILIISPYKKAFSEYKNEIKKLPSWAQKRVEARTVDVVQGHEADFVFLDLVKEKSTKFLDNPNRLCVALTRARLGEFVVVHPKMTESQTFNRFSENLRPIYNLCREAGQVVFVDPETVVNVTNLAVETTTITSHAATSSDSSRDRVDENKVVDSQSVASTSMTTLNRNVRKLGMKEFEQVMSHSSLDTTPAQKLAQLDEGEGWWDAVMSRSVLNPSGRTRQERSGDDETASVKVEATAPPGVEQMYKSLEGMSSLLSNKKEKNMSGSVEEDVDTVKYEAPVGSALAKLGAMFARRD